MVVAGPPKLHAPRALRDLAGVRGALPYATVVLLAVAIPLAIVLTFSLRESSFLGVGPGPTLDQYRDVLTDASTLRILARTVAVGLAVAATITAAAFVIAYGVTFRLGRRAGRAVMALIVGAAVASFVVRVYAWGTILGTKGLVNGALLGVGLRDQPLDFLFFGYFAILLTSTYVFLPVGVMVMYGAMQRVDRRTLEASRDLGVGRWRTLSRVVAPQVASAAVASFALCAILASADFVTPSLVGGAKGQMLGATIRDLAIFSGDYPAAAATAFVLAAALATSFAVLAALWHLTAPLRRWVSGRLDRIAARMPAGRATWTSSVSLSKPLTLLLAVYLVLPTLIVLVFSLNSSATLGLPLTGFTLHWYPDVLDSPGFGSSVSSSAQLLVFAVGGAIAVGIPMAFALRRATGRLRAVLWVTTLVPFVLPGVLVGLALLATADAVAVPLGKGLTALAHLALVTPVVVLVVHARLEGLDRHLGEAARDLGSTAWRAFRTVTLPLILPSLVGGALLAAAFSLDELPVTSFTIGTDSTLPLWLLGQARAGFTPEINAVGVMLTAGTLVVFVLGAWVLAATRLASGRQGSA